MLFHITYDYSQKVLNQWRTYSGNVVGRCNEKPIGYGYVGPYALFRLEELPEVVRVLTEQLKTVPTLHLHPHEE